MLRLLSQVYCCQKYLEGRLSLSELGDWAEDYQWSADGDPVEQHLMGTLELYLTEIDEGARTEAEFRTALQAALAQRSTYCDIPTGS